MTKHTNNAKTSATYIKHSIKLIKVAQSWNYLLMFHIGRIIAVRSLLRCRALGCGALGCGALICGGGGLSKETCHEATLKQS